MAAGGETAVDPSIWLILWPFIMAVVVVAMAVVVVAIVRAVRSRKKG